MSRSDTAADKQELRIALQSLIDAVLEYVVDGGIPHMARPVREAVKANALLNPMPAKD